MSKIVAGVVLGIALSCAFILTFNSDVPDQSRPDITDSVESVGGTVRSAPSTSSGMLEEPLSEQPDSVPDDAFEARQSDQASPIVEAKPAIYPVPTPPEFDAAFDADRLPAEIGQDVTPAGRMRAELEREPVDPMWAPTTEAQFYSYFADNPGIAGQFGTPTVYCRTTLCEIQVVTSPAAARSWLQVNRRLWDEEWAGQFAGEPVGYGFAITRVDDNTTTILQYVKRDEPQQTQSSSALSAAI